MTLSLRCPVCRATDNRGSPCRRCKADLSLLVRLEEERDRQLQSARQRAAESDAQGCLQHARRADALRRGAH